MRKPCIILSGPTAAGKTNLSIQLAKRLNGAVISADSMQVYRRMDIGSAKIMPEEMQGIDHYLINILDPREEFHVAAFLEHAHEAMEKIYDRGQIPIVVGGTGFYIQALLKDIDFQESSGELPLRKELEREASEKGSQQLHDRLKEVDPESAKAIHPNNVKRVIRALEYYLETGKPISLHNAEQKEKASPYMSAYFVLTDDRAKLYQRIEERVDKMIEAGLVEEVNGLMKEGLTEQHVSMQGLGYKELFPYLKGECSLEEAVAKIKLETRHFAKRQLTWFRRERDVIWINKEDFDYDEERILAFMLDSWNGICQTEKENETNNEV